MEKEFIMRLLITLATIVLSAIIAAFVLHAIIFVIACVKVMRDEILFERHLSEILDKADDRSND